MGKMKCIKFNAEIEQEAQFCPYGGTKILILLEWGRSFVIVSL